MKVKACVNVVAVSCCDSLFCLSESSPLTIVYIAAGASAGVILLIVVASSVVFIGRRRRDAETNSLVGRKRDPPSHGLFVILINESILFTY